MVKYWYIKLSNSGKLSRINKVFLLETSIFDPMTDFVGEPTSIIQYIVNSLAIEKITENGYDIINSFEWLKCSDEDKAKDLGKLFLKRPLCLLVFSHRASKIEYQLIFYLIKLTIKGDKLIYHLDYYGSLSEDIFLILSENWKLDISNSTIFIDKTRSLDRITSYLNTPPDLLDDIQIDIPNQ